MDRLCNEDTRLATHMQSKQNRTPQYTRFSQEQLMIEIDIGLNLLLG